MNKKGGIAGWYVDFVIYFIFFWVILFFYIAISSSEYPNLRSLRYLMVSRKAICVLNLGSNPKMLLALSMDNSLFLTSLFMVALFITAFFEEIFLKNSIPFLR